MSYATTGRGAYASDHGVSAAAAGIKLQLMPYTGGPSCIDGDVSTGCVAHDHRSYSGLAGIGVLVKIVRATCAASRSLMDVSAALRSLFLIVWSILCNASTRPKSSAITLPL